MEDLDVASRSRRLRKQPGGVVEGREAKDRLYEQFARVAKAVANAHRIELLELLAQTERTVESLAQASGMGITNTSAHLQALRRAGLVEGRREGTKVHYRLAGSQVMSFVVALRDLARTYLSDVDRIVRDYFVARDSFEPLTRAQLIDRAEQGEVVILDVRPAEEFAAGHIPGALSVPLDQLDAALAGLPRDTEIVAYCRGPYCVLAPQAVECLRTRGFNARRLQDGMPEWALAGLPVAHG